MRARSSDFIENWRVMSETTNKPLFLEGLKERPRPLPAHDIETNIKLEAEPTSPTPQIMESYKQACSLRVEIRCKNP